MNRCNPIGSPLLLWLPSPYDRQNNRSIIVCRSATLLYACKNILFHRKVRRRIYEFRNLFKKDWETGTSN